MIAHSGERRFDLGQQVALFFAGAEFIRTLTCVKSPGWRMCENGEMRLSAAQTALDTSAAVAPETRTVPFSSKRLVREWETLEAMIRIHCRDHHEAKAALCVECQELLDYAGVRLERCRFGAEKPTCAKCPVHCYQSARRDQVKAVMRDAGPRMIWEHPVRSLRRWLDGFRKAPG
jgi:hypothetical protein